MCMGTACHFQWWVATTVLNNLTWPHEVVYTLVCKPAAYQDISVPLFVQGYLIVMDTEEWFIRQKMIAHLNDLMCDAHLYGWDHARTFHGVWLNQLEQGHCTWMDEEEKLQFCRTLIFHPASSSSPSTPPTTRALGKTSQHSHKSPTEYNTTARPGTKACQAYTIMDATGGGGAPEHEHICSFCLLSINRAFLHSEMDCIRKGHST